MSDPTTAQLMDFMAKVFLVMPDVPAADGTKPGRCLTLVRGGTPRTKKERALQADLVRALAVRFSGDDYPELAMRLPEPARPLLGLIDGGKA